MPRRVTVPGGDDLFRPTAKSAPAEVDSATASGRVKHDEKMTVYLTVDELMAVEQARLELRSQLGRTVDRGRFVRAALAVALADLESRGTKSDVARRLSDS